MYNYSYMADRKLAALDLLEISRFELFNYIFLDNYLCIAGRFSQSHSM